MKNLFLISNWELTLTETSTTHKQKGENCRQKGGNCRQKGGNCRQKGGNCRQKGGNCRQKGGNCRRTDKLAKIGVGEGLQAKTRKIYYKNEIVRTEPS